ncbi:MAG: hypothetical protein ACQ9ET_00035 [Nitrosomonadaceae bacterium]
MKDIGIGNWITIVGMLVMGCGVFFTLQSSVGALEQRVTVLESAKPEVLANEIKGMKEDISEIKEDNGKLEGKIDRLIDLTIANRR